MIPMYDKTVTIVNKLKKVDSGVNATNDTWKKTVITNAEFKKKTVRTVSGSTVSIGESEVVLIPFGNGYLPYETWKTDTSKGYTMEPGDVIFYHYLTEVPTSANITALKQSYKNCDVKTVEVAKDNGMTKVQVKVEGV